MFAVGCRFLTHQLFNLKRDFFFMPIKGAFVPKGIHFNKNGTLRKYKKKLNIKININLKDKK